MRFVSAALAGFLLLVPANAMATPFCDAIARNRVNAETGFERSVAAIPGTEECRPAAGTLQCTYAFLPTRERATSFADALAAQVGQCLNDRTGRRLIVADGTRIRVEDLQDERGRGFFVLLSIENTTYAEARRRSLSLSLQGYADDEE